MENDPRIQKATKGLNVSVLSIILNPPEGCYGYLFVAFDGTGLSDYRVGHEYSSVSKGVAPTFVVSGEYDVFARIQRGEMTERKAILGGQLHLTGGMLKALRYLNALEAIGAALRELDAEV